MRIHILHLCAAILAVLAFCAPPAPAQGRKDYISGAEADKIRDAVDSNERIRLFLSFASDRLKQLQYELEHPANTVRRGEGDLLVLGRINRAASLTTEEVMRAHGL